MDYTVGEFARRTGLTARTLRHYEQLGLLRPAQRSAAGYRHYDEASLVRLHKVLAYRWFGLPLQEIASLLDAADPPLREVLARQAALVEEQIRRHQRLLAALADCSAALDTGATASGDALFGLVTAMRLCEESLSADDHRTLHDARAALAEDDLPAWQADMHALARAMETHRLAGDDPASAPVLALTGRMAALRDRLTGGGERLHAKLREVANQAPEAMRAQGVSPELLAYSRAAREAWERARAGEPPARKATAPRRRSAA